MTVPTPPAVSDTLRDAVAYLTPYPTTKGPVILDPVKMREAQVVIASEIARLTGERDATRAQADRQAELRNEAEAEGLKHYRQSREGVPAMMVIVEGARQATARAEAAEAEVARLTGERDAALAQWTGMAELVCEFAAEKAPDAIALVGADRDDWRKRALVAADAMTRLSARAEAAEAETARLRAALEGAKYLTKRRDLWLSEAQRLAYLVRELGGNPEPTPTANSQEKTDV